LKIGGGILTIGTLHPFLALCHEDKGLKGRVKVAVLEWK
jgi:hypothetical protein